VNRKDFLKNASIIGGASLLPTNSVFANNIGRDFDTIKPGLSMILDPSGEVLVGNWTELTGRFTVGNMLGIYIAVLLARRFAPTLNLASVEGACRFLLAAAVIAPIPAAAFAGGMLWWMTGADFLDSAQTWWFGHALSIAVLSSFGLALTKREVARLRVPARAIEATGLLGPLAAVSSEVFPPPPMPRPLPSTPCDPRRMNSTSASC